MPYYLLIGTLFTARNSVFAIFIGFQTKITGKLLKKHLIFSKNVIEMVKSQYHFSKTAFRVFTVRLLVILHHYITIV